MRRRKTRMTTMALTLLAKVTRRKSSQPTGGTRIMRREGTAGCGDKNKNLGCSVEERHINLEEED